MKYIMFNNDDKRIGSYEAKGELSFAYIEKQRLQGSHYRLVPEGQELDHKAGWVLDPQGNLQYNQGLADAAQLQENARSYRFETHDIIKGTKNFYWSEALYLPRWSIHVCPSKVEYENIIRTAGKLELIRDVVKKPMQVTSWIRPAIYNSLIKGATRSQHLYGLACDFVVVGMEADDVRKVLKPRLEEFQIRMENKPGTSWIHIDLGEVKHHRYFKP